MWISSHADFIPGLHHFSSRHLQGPKKGSSCQGTNPSKSVNSSLSPTSTDASTTTSVHGFSSFPSPLTTLLMKQMWNPKADQALQNIKEAFNTASILKHPDPTKPFIVEVGAFETGVGVIMSQRFEEKPKQHPVGCSKKLTPAKRNSSVANQELFTTISLRRHWLGGNLHPFLIFTDLKNL